MLKDCFRTPDPDTAYLAGSAFSTVYELAPSLGDVIIERLLVDVPREDNDQYHATVSRVAMSGFLSATSNLRIYFAEPFISVNTYQRLLDRYRDYLDAIVKFDHKIRDSDKYLASHLVVAVLCEAEPLPIEGGS